MASQSSHNDPLSQFGTNEWLVDEMYQRYLKDPDSVDKAWLTFFRDYHPESNGRERDEGTAATAEKTATTAALGPAPRPKVHPSGTDPGPSTSTRPATPPGGRTSTTSQDRATRTSARTGEPTAPAGPSGGPATSAAKAAPQPTATEKPELVPLRGAAARTAKNMDQSLTVPTATSVRQVPVKLLIDNRIVINNHLARSRGGKVSFTHLIGYAIAKAVRSMPEMNYSFTEVEGKPTMVKPSHLSLGLAIDISKPDGSRQLLVPNIKAAETLDFASFWGAYEDVVRRARTNKLTVEDFQGTTISLTNVGTVGTTHPVPRLMAGQSAIVGVGAMEYPAEYQGAAEETLNRLAVSKTMTLTSTYDHRVIQGAQSGEFLRRVHHLLLGEDDFYEDIFAALRIPYEPVRWVSDIPTSHDDEIGRQARVLELIHAYRVRGHLIADTDPLDYKVRRHADLDVVTHGLTLWDLDREFATGSFGSGKRFMMLRHILGLLRDAYSRTV
ncbi:MAG: 2-oxo acid dehydrogenase subunit E2, partial [Actinopolymorphaceae bacterium]